MLSLLHSASDVSHYMSHYTQVSLALLGLRQRNTYQENVPYESIRRMSKSGEPDGQLTYLDHYASDTNGFHVSEIVESSKIKARKMVYRAIQVCITSLPVSTFGIYIRQSFLVDNSSLVAPPKV